MKPTLRRVAKLEGQSHSHPRNSGLSRAIDSLSIDERILLADTPRIDGQYVGEPERLEAIERAIAKVDAFDG